MHDKPGILKLDVTSSTFEADLTAALSDDYELFATVSNFVILAKGYSS